jgi:hypothetical protein
MTREFILDTLLPYFLDPTTCAVNGDACEYKTKDGRMCAVGKHIDPDKYSPAMQGDAGELFADFGMDILTKEAQEQNIPEDIWFVMQGVHDGLAMKNHDNVVDRIRNLEYATGFSFPELKTAYTNGAQD